MRHHKPSNRSALRLATVLLAMLAFAPTLRGEAFDRAHLQQVEKRVQSVASKRTSAIVALTHQTTSGLASGTGTIISRDGLILTAAHVIEGAKSIEVTFLDGSTKTAKPLGADLTRDIAMCRLTDSGDYPFVPLGRSKDLKVGDLVVAMGHPGGFDERRTPPVRFGRLFGVDPGGYLRSDCALSGGDSGGPLFDLDGNLIGVHSSIGLDASVNNDVPVDVAHDHWKRLLAGEIWGKRPDGREAPRLPEKELAGLDVDAFRERLMAEAAKNNGQLAADPKTISDWLIASGMDLERVKAMEPRKLVEFLGKVMGEGAQVEAHGEAVAPLTDEELSGLDFKKFFAATKEKGDKNGGQFKTTPAEARKELLLHGMKAEKLAAMTDDEVATFVRRVATVGGAQEAPATRPAAAARENRGSGPKRSTAATRPATQPVAATQPAGFDADKLKAVVAAEAAKSNGKLDVTPDRLAEWMKQAGMPADEVAAMSPADLIAAFGKAMGGAAQTQVRAAGGPGLPSESDKVLKDQDSAMLEAVRPMLAETSRSVVGLFDGDKSVALGAVIHADGLVVTKRSEVSPVKAGALKAKLPDGKTVAARIVKEYAGHDLAIVKVEATELTVAKFDETDGGVVPGSLVFAPSTDAANPMLAMGAISVPARSLRDSGGFIGIGLKDEGDKVLAGTVLPEGPAAKAGLVAGDRLISIDGDAILKAPDLSRRVRGLKPGAEVKLAYQRGKEKERTATVVIGDREKLPVEPKEKANAMKDHSARSLAEGNVSRVRTGFPLIVQHDLPIKPAECGGPIIDLAGRIVGLNIARAGRVDTYALPASLLAKLLADEDLAKLATEK